MPHRHGSFCMWFWCTFFPYWNCYLCFTSHQIMAIGRWCFMSYKLYIQLGLLCWWRFLSLSKATTEGDGDRPQHCLLGKLSICQCLNGDLSLDFRNICGSNDQVGEGWNGLHCFPPLRLKWTKMTHHTQLSSSCVKTTFWERKGCSAVDYYSWPSVSGKKAAPHQAFMVQLPGTQRMEESCSPRKNELSQKEGL